MPTRSASAASGTLLVVIGLVLSLVGLMTLAFGSAAGWLDAARELVTPAHDVPAMGEANPGGEVDLEKSALREGGAPVFAPVQAVTVARAPFASGPDPVMPPTPTSSIPAPSVTPRAASAGLAPPAVKPAAAPTPFLPITRLHISRIGLEADVAPAQLVEREGGLTWEVPAFRAGHAEATAGAGGLGNAVILGHVGSRGAGDVFRGLHRARAGDRVRVFGDADAFEYRVVEVRTVPRTDVSVLGPTRTASLSLVTCTGTWLPLLRDYTQRLVVRAELVAPVGVPSVPTGAATSTTVFEERFLDNRQRWPSDSRSTAWFADGGYRLFAREPSRFVAVGAPIGRPLGDVVVTGGFRKLGGPPGGGYGLIVRDQGPEPRDGISQGGRYYVLEVGDRGEIGIWRREEDRWDELLPWSPSAAVRPGAEPNVLTVRAIGPRLTFAVNGVQVANLEDAALAAGGVGVFLGGDFNEGRLEWLVVEAP